MYRQCICLHFPETQTVNRAFWLLQVLYPGDPSRFFTRFDSDKSRDDKAGPVQLQLPGTASMVDRHITPLESMQSMISMIHPLNRESCLVFQKGDSNMLKEDAPPRQVLDRKWMWENVLQAMPEQAADAAKLARKHKLHVNLCAPQLLCICNAYPVRQEYDEEQTFSLQSHFSLE